MVRKAKQVIVVRADLKMPKGKLASQVSHASMGAFLLDSNRTKNTLTMKLSKPMNEWLEGSFTKIVVKVEDEVGLLEVCVKAKSKNLPYVKIIDRGDTVFNGVPTFTCVGIGPCYVEELEEITNNLKLL